MEFKGLVKDYSKFRDETTNRIENNKEDVMDQIASTDKYVSDIS